MKYRIIFLAGVSVLLLVASFSQLYDSEEETIEREKKPVVKIESENPVLGDTPEGYKEKLPEPYHSKLKSGGSS